MNATRFGMIGGSLVSAVVGLLMMRRVTVEQERGGPVEVVREAHAE